MYGHGMQGGGTGGGSLETKPDKPIEWLSDNIYGSGPWWWVLFWEIPMTHMII